ncbi:MAG: hypothetical protein IPJ17_14020 [Holophagales bacterium]|nr:MAG: hypothetical protein IPJ17_14020 [Holophagales bacterium]
MKRTTVWLAVGALALALLLPGAATAQDSKLKIGGTTYTKWLWGNQRFDGSLYNFTSVPGEGWGDNGQGSEVELLLSARLSKEVAVSARLHSRFSQNQWTNFGGFGGSFDPDGDGNPGPCVGGDCGEFDSRSNQYVKLRGVAVTLTPGYDWIDSATIGANDWGMFDPFVIGRIRYIDRDNGAGLLFQGSAANRKFTWDAARISLPRLWAGPGYATGSYPVQDAAYGVQTKFNLSSAFDLALIGQYVNDIEVDAKDLLPDNGRSTRNRFKNTVIGARFGIHPGSKLDVRGAVYSSSADSNPAYGAPADFFGISGFGPVPAGKHDDTAWKLNVDLNDPFGVGLSFNFEAFDIGAEYVAMMAARRESDVLLTEGSDATFAYPGPNNASFGVFGGNESKIGYGGWQGNAQQVATINVDNEFTDFDEPLAESVIGWKGFTVVPSFSTGSLDLSGELTFVDYNTNWQAWDDPSRPILSSIYPNNESDSGLGSFRNAYAPFQDKETTIGVIKFKYLIDAGKGIDLFGKFKMIDETDKRMTDARYLPYLAGDCPGGGAACSNHTRAYNGAGNSTADLYGNPPVITVNGITGYQWKPFDSLSDDDRDFSSKMFQLGAGYQLTDDLYASATLEHYDVDLKDGNTAFQAYQLHEMASGTHKKDKLILQAKYILAGAEIGLNYEYATGSFDPDFGGGFVVQYADAATAANVGVKVGSRGFAGRFGGWNSLEKRDFNQQRLKAFLKVQF